MTLTKKGRAAERSKRRSSRPLPRIAQLAGDVELSLGHERKTSLEKRARYETTRNRLAGTSRTVFLSTLVRRAVDEFLAKNPPEPRDAITAAMQQVSA